MLATILALVFMADKDEAKRIEATNKVFAVKMANFDRNFRTMLAEYRQTQGEKRTEMQKHIKAVREGTRLPKGYIDVRTAQPGEYGVPLPPMRTDIVLPDLFRVVQVFDKQSMLMAYDDKTEFLLSGVNTSKRIDDEKITLTAEFMVVEPHTYPTANGSIRTVRHLVAVDISKEHLNEMVKKSAKDIAKKARGK